MPSTLGFDDHINMCESCLVALGKYSKGAVNVHSLLDLQGNIPVNIHITDGKWHDNNMWAKLTIECPAIYTADKAYVILYKCGICNKQEAFS